MTFTENEIDRLKQAGYILAMRLLQSDLFKTLDDEERAAMDAFLLRPKKEQRFARNRTSMRRYVP